MDLDGATAVKVRSRGAARPGSVPALTIAAHPDPARVGDRAVLVDLTAGHAILLSRQGPDFVRPGSGARAPLGDRFVSRTPVRLTPADGGRIRIARGDSSTTIELDGREHDAIDLGPLAAGDGVPIALADRLVVVLHLVDPSDLNVVPAIDHLGMIGCGSGVQQVRREIARVVKRSVPVLIRGETGTGKELVARALHERGPRQAGPFVSVNLAAIARELAPAELFGAVRGAYTGAAAEREGYFRAAAGGTLFLDEVGDAPPEVQAMLLRVIETGELYPVGGQKPIATDVRLIAATDGRLESMIDDGRFKAPLLHRLAGHEVHLPPLRERPEDVGPLFYAFAREELAATDEVARMTPDDSEDEPWLTPAIAEALVRFRWPGNIRQLRNVTRQLVTASRGRAQLELPARLAAELTAGARPLPIAPVTLPPAAPGTSTSAEPPGEQPAARGRIGRETGEHAKRRRSTEVTEAELIAALREHAWDVKNAADHLNIPRSSIYDLIERSPNIRTARDLSPEEIARVHRECDGDLDRMAAALEVSRRALQRRVKDLGL